jgi:two-component system response regulator (stage 0 sporulation protein F)
MKENPRVLVVDDEASIRRNLLVGMAQRGYEVDACEEGLSALEKIEAARRSGVPHNYVILDIRLPDIDGLRLLSMIKEVYPDLPVVMISGYGDERTGEQVKERCGSAYLDKPFEIDALEAEIHRIGQPAEEERVPRPEVRTGEPLSQSAYIFLRGKPGTDLSGCFSTLYFAEGVCYCDAVTGDWDIVLLVQASDRRGIREWIARNVTPVPEIEQFEIHHSERPLLGKDIESFIRHYELMQAAEGLGEEAGDRRNRQLLSAYVLLEIDGTCVSSLYTTFYFDEDVVYCDMTENCTMAVLLVQGRTCDAIRQAVSRLRTRPGVLRARTLNIVKFQGM